MGCIRKDRWLSEVPSPVDCHSAGFSMPGRQVGPMDQEDFVWSDAL